MGRHDVFLQIWIGADDKLPRRMRAVYRADPLRLRHELDLSNWQIEGDPRGHVHVGEGETVKSMSSTVPRA